MSTPDLPFRPGDVLADKFRIEQVLGTGGMGVVLAARHIELDDRVAIKFLHPALAKQPEVVGRFLREAKAARKIRSEHVARVTDVGTDPLSGAPYMVMELLEGQDLAAVVQVRGALGPEEATEYLLQACEALAEAHAAGIVHRDLKPANLFLASRADGSPCIKVLDFGISKMGSGATASAMTKTQGLLGSPLYMSPEQLTAPKTVDHRTDIWALGVILFELLAARPPFEGEELPQLIAQILHVPHQSLAALKPGVPAEALAAIDRCLEKDRERRFAHVGEFAVALHRIAPKRARTSIERISRILGGRGVEGTVLPPSSGADAKRALAAMASASAPTVGLPGAAGVRSTSDRAPSNPTQGSNVQTFEPQEVPSRVPGVSTFRWTHAVATVAAVAVLGTGGFFLVGRAQVAPASPVMSAASTPPSPLLTSSSPSPLPPEALTLLPLVSPAQPSASTATSEAVHRAPAPIPSAKASASSAPSPPSVARSVVSAAPNCTPPFNIDARGNKVFKKECL